MSAVKPVAESVAIAEGAKYRHTATVLPGTNTFIFDKTIIFQDVLNIFPAYIQIERENIILKVYTKYICLSHI